jgi:hypothetical protein
VQLGVLARVHHGMRPEFNARIQRAVSFNRGALAAAFLSLAGVVMAGILVVHWLSSGLKLTHIDHFSVFGLLLIVLGFQTFAFTLLFQIIHPDR